MDNIPKTTEPRAAFAATGKPNPLPAFPYGADYFRKSNPPREDWGRDYQTASEDGMNVFRHWFIWSAIEVAPGEYDWSEYDRHLELGAEHGIKAVAAEMVTAGEGLPAPPLHRVSLTDPSTTRQAILEDYIEAVTKTGIVHGDLSEFNILVHEEGYPVYIDWPQAVPVSYPQADLLLARDLEIITEFFHRAYKLPSDDVLVRRTRAELEGFCAERQGTDDWSSAG